jgi:hypothetical protein
MSHWTADANCPAGLEVKGKIFVMPPWSEELRPGTRWRHTIRAACAKARRRAPVASHDTSRIVARRFSSMPRSRSMMRTARPKAPAIASSRDGPRSLADRMAKARSFVRQSTDSAGFVSCGRLGQYHCLSSNAAFLGEGVRHQTPDTVSY